MARQFMGGDFRAIRRAPAPVEPDPRLALVDLFRDTQVFRPEGHDPNAPLPEGALDFSGDEPMRVTADGSLEPAVSQTSGVIDLSGDAPDYSGLFVEDAQEAAEPTQPDADDNAPHEVQEAADKAPADAEQVEKVEVQEQDEQDYDPIAAVLG